MEGRDITKGRKNMDGDLWVMNLAACKMGSSSS
jgi:hypothetical protein